MLEKIVDMAKREHIPLYTVAEAVGDTILTGVVRPANPQNDIYSVSKNFTATAIGILVDRGALSLDMSVYDLFHEEYPDACTDIWKKVTVACVLEQTVGIGRVFLDIDAEDASAYGTDDYLKLVLEEPFCHAPGAYMQYSDSNYYLAARIAEKVAGERLTDFLSRELFMPLGFQGWAWACCPRGHAMGATGLFVRAQDMARFGMLYRDGGVYKGRRLLSQNWVREATKSRVEAHQGAYYGYSFWRLGTGEAFHCGGMNGQVIFISPSSGRVVAWQAYDPEGKCNRILDDLYRQEK